MNASHRSKKSGSPMSKIEDYFDGPNLLGLIRIEVEFEKSAKRLTKEGYENYIGVCGLGLFHGRGVL